MNNSDRPINNYSSDMRSSNLQSQKQSSFVRSLTSSPSIFQYITVEPATLFAVLALFIELPSVQDLIYTKICLQNVAIYNTTENSFKRIDTDGILYSKLNLPSSGRIQSDTNRQNNLPVSIDTSSSRLLNVSALSLCDRINKTALPRSVRELIESEHQRFWLIYQLIICIMCALSAPYWGGMSDRIGRIIPLNVPISMSIISNLSLLTLSSLIALGRQSSFPVEWLYASAVLIGISGGQAVVIVNSFSFVSDNSSVESRSKRIVVLETVQSVAQTFGYLIAKHIMILSLVDTSAEFHLIPINRHFVAFLSCVILNLFCILYSVVWLRHHKFHRFLNNFEREQQEAITSGGTISAWTSTTGQRSVIDSDSMSLSTGQLHRINSTSFNNIDSSSTERRSKCLSALWTFKYYAQTYRTITKSRECQGVILLLLLSGFISSTHLALKLSLLYIYLKAEPFSMETSQYSSWNMWTSLSQGFALISLSLSMKFVRDWNVPDPLVASLGFLSKSLGLIMIGLAQSSSFITWASAALVFSEFSMPPIRSLLSKLVMKEELAKVYSCLSAVLSICFVFSNVGFYLAYNSISHQSFYRLTFLIVAGLEMAGFAIMLYVYSALRRRTIIL